MLAILLLVGFAAAAKVPTCQVTEWTEWSECTVSEDECPAVKPRSFHVEQPSELETDRGRMAMEGLRAEKMRQWGEMHECRNAGTCPELMPTDDITGQEIPCEGEPPLAFAGEFPCQNVNLLSYLNFTSLGGYYDVNGNGEIDVPLGNDIWGWTDPTTAREYAIMGMTTGTAFVEITNPVKPNTLAFMPSTTRPSDWRDMKVINDFVYIVSEAPEHGLQIFDLTTLRTFTGAEIQVISPTAMYEGFGHAHNIVASPNTQRVYGVGSFSVDKYPNNCEGGLHAVDVSDPLNPQFAGCFGGEGYVHDAECLIYNGPDANYAGDEICFCYNEDTFTIVAVDSEDVSNSFNISRVGYEGSAYTHQGWSSPDLNYALLDDELDELTGGPPRVTRTYMWNIMDLANPVLIDTFLHPHVSIDHNQYIIGDLSYMANYASGLRIMQIEPDYTNLTEVGSFDVDPDGTTAQFRGAWSVYPYFPSGNLIVSSIERGLFVLRPTVFPSSAATARSVKSDSQRSDVYAESPASGLKTRSRDIISKDLGATCPSLTETVLC